jgi:hypothetical protein
MAPEVDPVFDGHNGLGAVAELLSGRNIEPNCKRSKAFERSRFFCSNWQPFITV